MKNTIKTLVLLFSIILISCNENEEVSTFDENTIAKELKFEKINLKTKKNSQTLMAKKKLVILSWDEWGRKSKNCGGWGLCNANWFYCVDENDQEVPCKDESKSAKSEQTNGLSVLLQYDTLKEKYYIEMLLSEPTEISTDLLSLKIDSSFDVKTKEAVGKDLIFKNGDYNFDTSLGEFGGYRVYLD